MYTNDTPIGIIFNNKGLICAYKSGQIQLMKNDSDVNPMLINSDMVI